MPGKPSAYHAAMVTQYPLIHQGKVRDSFAIDAEHLLIVASDRLSAFDGQGRDPDTYLQLLVRAHPRHRSESPQRHRPC
jgi:hypothetical protein